MPSMTKCHCNRNNFCNFNFKVPLDDINKASARCMFKFLDGSQCPFLISSRCIDPEENSSNILCSSCMVDSIKDSLDNEKEKEEELLSEKNKVVIAPNTNSDSDSDNENFFVSHEADNNALPPADMLNSRGNTEGTEKMIAYGKKLKMEKTQREKNAKQRARYAEEKMLNNKLDEKSDNSINNFTPAAVLKKRLKTSTTSKSNSNSNRSSTSQKQQNITSSNKDLNKMNIGLREMNNNIHDINSGIKQL
jgi:hypothetical protein